MKVKNHVGWLTLSGLTNQARNDAQCDRCTMLLKFSNWKGHNIFYSKSKSSRHGFLCIKCATSKNREAKRKVTIQQLDEYIQKKFRQIIKRGKEDKLI